MTPPHSSSITDTTVLSALSVSIPAPYRGQDLKVRVTVAAAGEHLPVIVFGHGFGLTNRDYAPLVDYWAARGYAVIQPEFLDSARLGIAPTDPRTPDIWRLRVTDMSTVLDNIDLIEQSVPGLGGRLDRTRFVAAGHSYGATTASMLLGARVRSSTGEVGESMSDNRFTVGVLFSITGDGGGLNEMAAQYFPFMRPDFDGMTTAALIVAGDHDQSPLGTRGPDWFTDAFTLSPSDKTLLTVSGGEHGLGGINGYNDTRTTDESPARVEFVSRASVAYLEKELDADFALWDDITAQPADGDAALGHFESK
jgi:predicted dienelactone hydrolase